MLQELCSEVSSCQNVIEWVKYENFASQLCTNKTKENTAEEFFFHQTACNISGRIQTFGEIVKNCNGQVVETKESDCLLDKFVKWDPKKEKETLMLIKAWKILVKKLSQIISVSSSKSKLIIL